MDERISKDLYYLGIAKSVAARSTCLRRNYGAVIVAKDEIIATGYNGAARGVLDCLSRGTCRREELHVPKGERYELCVAVHAEQNAIISAARRDMIGATLYIVGLEHSTGMLADPHPCLMCQRSILNSGVSRVVGLTGGGAVDLSPEVFNFG